ncbi:hypothetical protein XFF7766_280041 [Xanthomonas citri pv. fuscans]|nr:hypothetical protein XFF7766_280041 [Xanthomonas citri pv. fuscans]
MHSQAIGADGPARGNGVVRHMKISPQKDAGDRFLPNLLAADQVVLVWVWAARHQVAIAGECDAKLANAQIDKADYEIPAMRVIKLGSDVDQHGGYSLETERAGRSPVK